MTLNRSAWPVVVAASLATAACDGAACGDFEQTTGATAPVIDAFTSAGQLQGDPWTIILAVDFRDEDGDLGGGRAQFFLNGDGPSTEQPMADIFRQSGLPDGATAGKLGWPLRFGDTVGDGSTVKIGLQLVDAAEQRSNCYRLDLDFKVRSAASSFWERGVRLARR